MSAATIYRIEGGYLLYAESKTISGFYIASEPFIRIHKNEVKDKIIESIKNILNHVRTERVPDPNDWKKYNKDFLQRTGLKSLKQLNKSEVKNLSIVREEDQIIFTPTKHLEKPDEGFSHKGKEEAVIVSYSAPNQEIAEAIELAFDKCE